MEIGWIGLGKMGLPMSRRLRDAGHLITVLARHDAGRARAQAEGYAPVTTLPELARKVELVMSSVSDDEALLDIGVGPHAMAAHLTAGQAWIETSTVSPEASRKVADLVEARGATYLRAPVSGSTALAEAGTLTTMVSGPRDAFERLQPIFAACTRRQFYLGDDEQARYMKLAVNAMVGATAALMAESLAFSGKGGIALDAALEVFCDSAVASPLMQYKRAMILEGHYEPAFAVSQIMKDLDILLSVGRATHAPQPLAAQIRQQFEAAYLRGNGERDLFVLVREMAELAGVWQRPA
jgi:3-hydroxyisobutyrate dehydrogenase-like beta-hydroxyacid dehydrogenase